MYWYGVVTSQISWPAYFPQHAGTVPAGSVTLISSDRTPSVVVGAVDDAAGGGAAGGGAAVAEGGATVTVSVDVGARDDGELPQAATNATALTSPKTCENLRMNESLPDSRAAVLALRARLTGTTTSAWGISRGFALGAGQPLGDAGHVGARPSGTPRTATAE